MGQDQRVGLFSLLISVAVLKERILIYRWLGKSGRGYTRCRKTR
jgi:hypothetical protein